MFLFTCVTFRHFDCDLFALLSTLTYLDGHGTNGMISPGYHLDISDENVIIFLFCLADTGNGFIQETPIENQFFEYCLSTNLGKMKHSMDKVTQVIPHTGVEADLFQLHIS